MLKYILVNIILILLTILSIILFIVYLIKSNKNKSSISTCRQRKADTIYISFSEMSYEKTIKISKNIMNFYELKNKLKDISENKKIKNILIDVDNTNLSVTQVEELESIFEKINKEKNTYAFGSVFDNNSYLIALLAKKIYLMNTVNSNLILKGYYSKKRYYKKFLEKLGIKLNVLHIGDFKSAYENFNLESMSDEAKINLKELNEKKLSYFIKKVKKYRNVDIENDLNEGNLFLNDENKDLFDGKVNRELFIEEFENIIEINGYKPSKNKNKSKNIIGLISLDGEVKNNSISLENVKNKLDQLRDHDIKGLVIEINSPGGSAYESSLIYSYIKKTVYVPIFISMKDVSASGGYFISCVGRKIFANESTLTGSIGVVSIYPEFDEALNKIGINIDGVEKGEHSNFMHFEEKSNENTKIVYTKHMEKIYKEFKNAVSRARLMSGEMVEKRAKGRVYFAEDALENNLIDGIKNLDETIESLANYLKIEDYKIMNTNRKIDIKEEFSIKNLLIDTAIDIFSEIIFD